LCTAYYYYYYHYFNNYYYYYYYYYNTRLMVFSRTTWKAGTKLPPIWISSEQ